MNAKKILLHGESEALCKDRWFPPSDLQVFRSSVNSHICIYVAKALNAPKNAIGIPVALSLSEDDARRLYDEIGHLLQEAKP